MHVPYECGKMLRNVPVVTGYLRCACSTKVGYD